MKDNMLRLIYGEMMGQDVQFGAIYALKLAQSGQTVAEKRAGYLACYLLLHEGNELNIMLINTLQKDLASSNYHHVVVALVTLSNMMLPDVIPSVIGHVLAALSHTHESVRKRALIVLKSFYVQQAELVAPYLSQIKECLYDHEPSVMSAALGFFVVVVKSMASCPKGTRIMGLLRRGFRFGVYKSWPNSVTTISGILFEIIRTLNCFHLDIMLELVQSRDISKNPLLVIAKFATASNQNLKYLGIAMLCQVHPAAWSDTWWSDQLLAGVVEALDSRDKTIQRKALDLLYRMLTYENSENIIDRLILAQILDASERFGKSEGWYVDLIFDLMQAGSIVSMRVAEKFMRVFERGPASPAFSIDSLRQLAVQKALDVMEQANYRLDQRSLAYFALWILGEYADESIKGGPTSIMVVLSRCLAMNQDPLVVAWTLTALTKVILRIAPSVPEEIMHLRAQEFLLVAEMV
ncbi:hypothetical protein BG006_004103 [Podila minutissima]|uniref:Clathrin/coatomer adaptor adaptin-like N-terminal domain-containing protein n=1 Tax=Podila minutissima TaxID=64525 RepID=A0A9P5SQQ3_9FUNG|nr:hypothetical protein BG006_004103 [Podila minutissima]